MNRKRFIWLLWLGVNVSIVGFFAYALVAPASSVKSTMLPGTTTHGHFQIELDCNACHSAAEESAEDSAAKGRIAVGFVMQDACIRCHGQQLKQARDTHPAKKFNDPTNADRLLTLDAQDCLTCHREHVPDQTVSMGLTIPVDYCWHCHQDVADSRPSHANLTYDSCATAGCHNYHDNRALYEKFLDEHFDEPDHLASATLPARTLAASWAEQHGTVEKLSPDQADAPRSIQVDAQIVDDWAQTSHAAAGVNCSGCHQQEADTWSDAVSLSACAKCHERQRDSFLTGRHGMRLASGMSPMTPAQARLSMHVDAAHRQLTCNACHQGHRFDTQFAAVQACQQCHADAHTLAYRGSAHQGLWQQELDGKVAAGNGVSCASCHMPRLNDGGEVWVNHDQNSNLRPSETMAREVCMNCHGLEYSLSALADESCVNSCFSTAPSQRVESVQMAHDWFETKRTARARRNNPKGSNQ